MCCKGVLKRLLPFFLTLAAGLFIASFFVDLTPTPLRDRGMRKFRDYQEMKMENTELRQRLAEAQQENDRLRKGSISPNAPLPPPPPKALRTVR
jgi:hypothetical protein